MAFATNTNLEEYAPEVFQQGVDDWTEELAKAETDVINMIQFNGGTSSIAGLSLLVAN